MPRVLLLHESGADFQTTRSIELLAKHLAAGSGADFSVTARSVGPGGAYPSAAAALYRLRQTRADFDLVHAWGPHALTLAAMATSLPLFYSPPPVVGSRAIDWARAVAGYRNLHVICPTSTSRRLHVERGVPLDRTHLIRPGVDFARVKSRRDASLRQRLGFAPDDRVILAVGEHTHAAHHAAVVWATGVLHVLEPRHRLLLWGRGRLAGRTARFAGQVDLPVTVAERDLGRRVEFEELLGVADVAVVSARGQVPTLPIQIVMAAGLPIISSVSYTTGELLEDRHTALMVPRPLPRLLARRMRDLFDDTRLQWAICDRARAEAYDYYTLSRFLGQYRTAYRQVGAGKPVDIGEPAAASRA